MSPHSPSAFSVGDIVGTPHGKARVLKVMKGVKVEYHDLPKLRKTSALQTDWLTYKEIRKL